MNISTTTSHALFLAALMSIAPALQAQDIFLFDMERQTDGYALTNGKNLTHREGYDNQPFFTRDSRTILFASQRDGDNDIYEYVINTEEIRQLTDTPEIPEYSPMPNAENTHFTVVRENTAPDQTVWRVERDTGASEWALESREPIGYYMFNQRGEALLWLRYAYMLELFRPGQGEPIFITGHAAPSTPKLVPGTNAFSFVHRQVNGENWVKTLDPTTLSITPVAPLVEAQIYYGWTKQGTLLTARGSTLLHWAPGVSAEWREVVDLASFGLRNITRLKVSPDGTKIAIVADDTKPAVSTTNN
jgi:WD40-like Beta Propeller Repeat